MNLPTGAFLKETRQEKAAGSNQAAEGIDPIIPMLEVDAYHGT